MVQPLAYRMRPAHIDEVAGQEHIIGKHTTLYKMIKSGNVPSVLLYGEPGIGKTSIANAIAGTVSRPFFMINATTAGKKDIEEVVKQANKLKEIKNKELEELSESATEEEKKSLLAKPESVILFIDEVHRFNKVQQDALLPHVESGLITLIGATTENPYHSVNPAIRSRCGMIKELKRLTEQDIKKVLAHALQDEEKGLASYHPSVSDELLMMIGRSTNGEVRSALSILEMAVLAAEPDDDGVRVVTKELIEECTENKGFSHDKGGDAHYDTLSALQKSIRGSDLDAAMHYLARLIEAGDLISICRRLVVIAYEDISVANPEAGMRTLAATEAAVRLGFPEARIPLANIVVDLCLSPKSNAAYKALDRAIADIKAGNVGEIPLHLKDAHYASASKLGRGVEYKYPHDYPIGGNIGAWVPQQYLPDLLKDREYFESGHSETDKKIYKWYRSLKDKQRDGE